MWISVWHTAPLWQTNSKSFWYYYVRLCREWVINIDNWGKNVYLWEDAEKGMYARAIVCEPIHFLAFFFLVIDSLTLHGVPARSCCYLHQWKRLELHQNLDFISFLSLIESFCLLKCSFMLFDFFNIPFQRNSSSVCQAFRHFLNAFGEIQKFQIFEMSFLDIQNYFAFKDLALCTGALSCWIRFGPRKAPYSY